MAQTPDGRPNATLPLSQLITLSIYWFGIVLIWGGLNKIIVPAMIGDLPGGEENLGLLLAIIVTVGVVAPIVIQPTVGTISDYTVTRWGRRKPYIVIGALLDVVFLIGIARPRHTWHSSPSTSCSSSARTSRRGRSRGTSRTSSPRGRSGWRAG